MQSDNPVSGSSQRSILLSDRLLIGIFVASLAITLTYVRSLIYFDTPSIVFDAAHLLSVVALTIILFKSSGIKSSQRIFLLALWVLTMRMLIPIRFPEGILTNYPDMIYELQIVQNIAASGGITFNPPTYYGGVHFHTDVRDICRDERYTSRGFS